MSDPAPATPTPAPTEPIEGPGPSASEKAPNWMLGSEKEKGPVVERPVSAQETDDARDALTSIIAEGHSWAADRTHYENFRLLDEGGEPVSPRAARMLANWRVIIRYIFKRLPAGDWPVAIAGISLAVSYFTLVLGYREFKKSSPPGSAEPTKVPAGASGGEMPSGALGVGGPPLEA